MVKKKLELRLSCKLRAREEEEQHGTVSTFIKRIEEKRDHLHDHDTQDKEVYQTDRGWMHTDERKVCKENS